MKLKIVGNIVEFNNTVESYKSALRTELENKSKRVGRVRKAFFISFICSFILAVFLYVSGHNLLANLFHIVSVLGVYTLFIFNKWNKSSKDIDNEVISSVRKTYGDRLDIFEAYQAGNILLAKISQNPGNYYVGIRFAVDGIHDDVRIISIIPSYKCSSNVEYNGVVELNLQKNTVVYYYKDELTEGEELELVNQWLPKSGDLCENE